MKTYHVVAAIIKEDNRIFATQRGYGDYKDGWEFPGGKIEPGETPEQALVREIQEELDMTIAVDRHVVDGFFNGLAWGTHASSNGLKTLQSGRVQQYAFVFLVGTLLLILMLIL